MSSDRFTNAPSPAWREVGTGISPTKICWTRNKPRVQLGGRKVGPLKLFKCAVCVTGDSQQQEVKCES